MTLLESELSMIQLGIPNRLSLEKTFNPLGRRLSFTSCFAQIVAEVQRTTFFSGHKKKFRFTISAYIANIIIYEILAIVKIANGQNPSPKSEHDLN